VARDPRKTRRTTSKLGSEEARKRGSEEARKTLLPTIKSIVNQNMKIDAIYLNIPVEMTQNPTYQTFLMKILIKP
jgi:hypothetical protein